MKRLHIRTTTVSVARYLEEQPAGWVFQLKDLEPLFDFNFSASILLRLIEHKIVKVVAAPQYKGRTYELLHPEQIDAMLAHYKVRDPHKHKPEYRKTKAPTKTKTPETDVGDSLSLLSRLMLGAKHGNNALQRER